MVLELVVMVKGMLKLLLVSLWSSLQRLVSADLAWLLILWSGTEMRNALSLVSVLLFAIRLAVLSYMCMRLGVLLIGFWKLSAVSLNALALRPWSTELLEMDGRCCILSFAVWLILTMWQVVANGSD